MTELIIRHESLTWVVVMAALIAIVFLIKEWIRTNRKHRVVRIVVALVAVMALTAIVLKPAIKTATSGNVILMLTSNYDEGKRDSIKNVIQIAREYKYDTISYFNSPLRADSIIVIGEGIPTADLPLWTGTNMRYIPGRTPAGIYQISVNSHLKEGQELVVRGKVNLKKEASLMLSGFGNVLDSVVISADQNSFYLQPTIKSPGHHLLKLIAIGSESDTLLQETLPIQVEMPKRLNILMVNGIPTFESKYLKNFLAEEGHSLVVRNQLTKGRYNYAYYNHDPVRFGFMSTEFLSGFDVVILDYPSLSTLSSSQRSALTIAVEESGVGLFLLPDKSLFIERNDLMPFSFNSLKRENVTITIDDESHGHSTDHESHGHSTFGYAFNSSFGLETILSTDKERVAASMQKGAGKIGVSLLSNTYQLVLKGEEEYYRNLWKKLIEGITKAERREVAIDYPFAHAIVDYPFEFNLYTNQEQPDIAIDSVRIPLIQHPDIQDRWSGIFWPHKTGWHKINTNDSLAGWVYVFDQTQWQGIRAYTNMINTSQLANSSGYSMKPAESVEYKKINPLWFYLLFLAAAAYLWLEPKLA